MEILSDLRFLEIQQDCKFRVIVAIVIGGDYLV